MSEQAYLVHAVDDGLGFPEWKLFGAYKSAEVAMKTATKLRQIQEEIRARNPHHRRIRYTVAGWTLQEEIDAGLDLELEKIRSKKPT